MNLIIFGATGKTGQHLVTKALSYGDYVTAFVRDPSKLSMTNGSLQIVRSDINDYGAVENAIRGKDAVLCTLGASSPFKFDQSVVDGVDNIIQAMKVTGVKRFIYLSFIGVTESRKQGGFIIRNVAPILLSTEIDGHEARETLIKKSDLAWTIIRAATLTNSNQVRKYRLSEDTRSTGFTATISRADVADAMLNQVQDTSFIQKAPGIMY